MTRHGDPRFYQLLDEIAELHSRKNHDYAPGNDPLANFRQCEKFGVPAWKGCLTRMSDKWSRLQQLAGGKEPKNESLRDTLIDLSVYSLICILLTEPTQAGHETVRPSYDEARANPQPCKCGKLVTRPEQCDGPPCPIPTIASSCNNSPVTTGKTA